MTAATLKERARDELRRYAIVAGYLYVCLAALMLYKSALLETYEPDAVTQGVAAIKALVLGKFILIGEALGVGTRLDVRSRLGRIAARSLLFFVMLVLLTLAEEFVVGRLHGHSLAETAAELGRRSPKELFAGSLLMLLVLVPLAAAAQWRTELHALTSVGDS